MAFNPFHKFRKHQKVVFAGLTIICMLTFVMASGFSGRGDFFGEVSSWFGGKSRVTEIAKVYGKKLDPREIHRLRAQRQLANEFMENAVALSSQRYLSSVAGKLPDFDKTLQQQMSTVQMWASLALRDRRWGMEQYQSNYQRLQRTLAQMASRMATQKKTDDLQKVQMLRALMDKEHWRLLNRDELNPGPALYFGGSTSLDGLVDFLIWNHEADRLGINLTADDIKKAIGKETLNLLTQDDSEAIQKGMQMATRGVGISLLEALGQEFRARLAQAALTGYDATGNTQVPATVTPYELWDYYLKNRTQVSVKLLPIPVSKFEAQVKAEPTAQELQALYDKYKNAEYGPQKDTPGFLQPRRVKVEWVKVSPEADYYRKQAQTALVAQTVAMATNPVLAEAWTTAVLREYETLSWSPAWNSLLANRLTDPNFSLALYTYKNVSRPETVASTVGLALAPTGYGVFGSAVAPGGSSLFAALMTVPARAAARERQELAPVVAQEAVRRLPLAGALFSAATSVAPPLSVSAAWLQAEKPEQYLPLALVEPRILKELETKLATTLAANDRTNFKTELETVKKEAAAKKAKPNAAAQEFIKKQLERYKWEHGSSTELHGRYDIARDPGLKGLLGAYATGHPEETTPDKRFGDLFFGDLKPDPTKLYTPEELRVPGDILYWKTEDQAAERLSFDKVRDRVAAAWRLERARPLAEKEAERIAQEARKTKDPIPNLTEAAKGEKLIDMDGIARLTQQPSTRMGFGGAYTPYVVPETKIEYPGRDFVDKVLDLKQVGDVVVVHDQPQKTYYVVAVTHRNEPSRSEFRDAQLLPQLGSERRLSYRINVLSQLREQARVVINEEGRKQVEEKGNLLEE